MESVENLLRHLWYEYEWALTRADDRVADWPLMWAYWPTFALTAVYLLIVCVGPKLMNGREPFEFRWTLFLYNAGLVALNFHIFSELFTATWKLNYSYSCQLVDYSNNPDEMRIAKAIWWYYFSKLLEFMDTIFFILRKKDSQISFLHVYHHATMFPIWWIGARWVPGGQAFFGAMINSFVHVLMYSYYGLSALGPRYQKYLWWKKYLTRIQLVQFVAGMSHAAQSIYLDCKFPRWMQWALIIYGTTILSLFINFYIHSYIRPSKSAATVCKEPAVLANGDAHTSTAKQHLLNGEKSSSSQMQASISNGHSKSS
jgi:elongation of very long chain fatty acids protein 4